MNKYALRFIAAVIIWSECFFLLRNDSKPILLFFPEDLDFWDIYHIFVECCIIGFIFALIVNHLIDKINNHA